MEPELTCRRCFLSGVLAAVFLMAFAPAHGQDTFEAVERVVAVGDIHGDLDELVGLLRSAQLLDRRNRWIGGRAHLVQTGDLVDRGAESRKVMDLLMKLEREAEKAGGRVHVLLGNHEVMNMVGDLRYTTAEEYASYRSSRSEELRAALFDAQATEFQKADEAYRRKWEQEHPLGWLEHRLAFGVTGTYGKWLRQKNLVIKINQILFLHGGISPKYLSMPIGEMNQRARADLTKNPQELTDSLIIDPEGPLWYRAIAQAPEAELAAHIDNVLTTFGVQHIVAAHTPTPGVVLPRFGGKVIMIDVGISEYYGSVPACLVFQGMKPYALHRGHSLELPVGANIMGYLKTAASYDPPNSLLQKWIDRLTDRGAGSIQ